MASGWWRRRAEADGEAERIPTEAEEGHPQVGPDGDRQDAEDSEADSGSSAIGHSRR